MSVNDDEANQVAHEAQPLLSPEDRRQSEPSLWVRAAVNAAHTANTAIRNDRTYVLFIFLPLGIAARLFGWPAITTLIFNLLAIIPLSALISYSADELSIYVGELVGELINATFGNAVELIVGILALSHGKVGFVQSTMLGSILSDILLVLGICLSYAAYGNQIPRFNTGMADALSSLMIITATALILPTALYSSFSHSDIGGKILDFSRGSAVVLFALYLMYLYFQLKTHNYYFLGASNDSSIENEETNEEPNLGPWTATIVLFSAAGVIMGCTHLIIDSVEDTATFANITETFIAAILIPIASNAPEGATVVYASREGKVDFAIGVIVGSILQIALFVIPFLVILGWCIQQPMTLYFEPFQTTMLFLSVLVVNRLLQDGKYTYVQGAMLVALYAVIATAFFIRPEVTADITKRLSL